MSRALKFLVFFGLITVWLMTACQTPNTIKLPNEKSVNPSAEPSIPEFRKIALDTVFRSESVTAADLNNDNLLDIVIGDVWYQAPDWVMHEIRTPGKFDSGLHKWGEESGPDPYYSNSFAIQSIDVNEDGWMDVITFPVMNDPVFWYENPRGIDKHWNERVAYQAYHGESPLKMRSADDKILYPLAGFITGDTLLHLGTIKPSKNINEHWQLQTIGNTSVIRYKGPGWDKMTKFFAPGARDHGLGIGDINGDGIEDVLTRKGWYEAPVNSKSQDWEFHSIPLDTMASAEAPNLQFAQMEIFDIDQDGDADFFGSSAHQYGLWWFEHIKENGKINFIKHNIPVKLSQAHAVAKGDLNNNGIPDIVTGKRYLAHTGNDPGWNDPIELFWLEPTVTQSGKVEWATKVLDVGVGVGTQIELVDINSDGKVDILTSNKKGTQLFLQK